MTTSIVPIVEATSEVEAVPVLMRRLLHQWGEYQLAVEKPVRVKRNRVTRQGELERRVVMALQRPNCRAVMVIMDADDDCPKDLAPKLLRRAQAVARNVPVSVVLPKAELESWFVGSIESLHGIRGVSAQARSPSNPEAIRDAKGFLTQAMQSGRRYLETDDQPAFAEKFDVQRAYGNCRSFRKFHDDFRRIVHQLTT